MELLIEEILKGKKGAATKFYRLFAPKIKKYLYTRLPTHEDVEDLVQEIFLSAFDSLPLYRGEAKPLTWLLGIARHEVADFYRKRYVRRVIEKTGPLFEEMFESRDTPDSEFEKARIKARFKRTYVSLNKQYQDVLSYRYELSMSVKEIATKMKLSFKAAESLLYRARSAFAVAYDKVE